MNDKVREKKLRDLVSQRIKLETSRGQSITSLIRDYSDDREVAEYVNNRNKLFLDNLGLVEWILQPLPVDYFLKEELREEFKLILLESIDSFDFEKGTSLSSYVYWKMKNSAKKLITHAMSQTRISDQKPEDEESISDSEDRIFVEPSEYDDEETQWLAEKKSEIIAALGERVFRELSELHDIRSQSAFFRKVKKLFREKQTT